jgi:S1-C subfamily serine protease
VLSVSPDTPAKKAGLAMGDVIVKLAGKKVENLYDLQRLLTDQVIGREITISVLRSEKLQEFKITPSDYVSQ